MDRLRIRAEVQGIVQGVGFRPFVYQLARRLGLTGYVQNTSDGVLLEVEGPGQSTDSFFLDLREKAPPLAHISRLQTRRIDSTGDKVFLIRESLAQATRTALISPDVAVCQDCLGEMFDPADRRYRYPFINCTNCGPRYTIITDVPYDRAKTSMKVFAMCPECEAEYHDPANRRFHAQPNACPVCGPQVTLLDELGQPVMTREAVRSAAELLRRGMILAVKGLGGFHLAVDATNERAVRRLRSRKQREEKPLAVMSPDLDAIRTYARVGPYDLAALTSIQRPIVLLESRDPSPLAPGVAPDNKYIGAMLPYTPLHHLLLKGFQALVMTSGNLSEEPIAIDNDEALIRLTGMADYFLVHNRDIYLRSDDSVVRAGRTGMSQIRRSRGFVPVPVFLKRSLPPVLAVGGEMKSTVCLTKDDRAFVSQHIGDLENLQTLEFFELTIAHLRRILDIEPVAVALDLHPEYLSSKWALERAGVPLVKVQHHHAHVVSAMAEHHLEGEVIGVACDGTGYGDDGCIWGGEVLVADEKDFRRAGRLEYVPLPGGGAAIREPWRMALSWLEISFGTDAAGLDLEMLSRQDQDKLKLLRQVINRRIGSPLTSSLGRLFDAAAALVGLKDRVAFEGQAAMMLEMCCPEGFFEPYGFEVDREGEVQVLKPQAAIRDLVRDLASGRGREEISGRFHATVVAGLAETVRQVYRETGLMTVVLSGGCFQNRVLTRGLTSALVKMGLNVYTQSLVPVNDGGLSLGQAVCAGMRLKK
jgi:hydrogenase maturation protein HypF